MNMNVKRFRLTAERLNETERRTKCYTCSLSYWEWNFKDRSINEIKEEGTERKTWWVQIIHSVLWMNCRKNIYERHDRNNKNCIYVSRALINLTVGRKARVTDTSLKVWRCVHTICTAHISRVEQAFTIWYGDKAKLLLIWMQDGQKSDGWKGLITADVHNMENEINTSYGWRPWKTESKASWEKYG